MQNELPPAPNPAPDSADGTPRPAGRTGRVLPGLTPNRDSVTTIRSDGSRPFLFPADPHGRFNTARRVSAVALIAFYLSLPWIKINGFPAVFLDVADRRFHLFGVTLAAQDMWLLFFVITGLGFSLFFITALLGRVWCGWACPQTVFLDHVYRRIERWIDGDALKRRALANAPLSAGKIFKRGLKHTLYFLVSAVITHLFLAYFVSLEEVWSMVRHAPTEHWTAFAFIMIATAILYFNFAWFREQLCIVICPYGRIQSALIDDHSLAVGYDATRGEPRGARPAGLPDPAAAKLGDCVACNRCVQVCPTGIDIRHGLQNECIGCAACIDACNGVMDKVGSPRGLIRYATENGMAQGWTRGRMFRRALRPRVLVYGMLLLLAASAFVASLTLRSPFRFDVIRDRGALARIVDDGVVENVYRLQVMNRSERPQRYHVAVVGPSGLQVQADPVEVAPTGIQSVVARVRLPPQAASSLAGRSIPIAFELRSDPTGASAPVVQHEDSTFFVPR